jgi:nitrogen regulatory protein PII-like uncharacterized protein
MSDLNKVIDNLEGVKKLLNSIKFKEVLTGDRLSEEKVKKIKSATDEYIQKLREIIEV